MKKRSVPELPNKHAQEVKHVYAMLTNNATHQQLYKYIIHEHDEPKKLP